MNKQISRGTRTAASVVNKHSKQETWENNARPIIETKKKFWISGFILIILLIGGGLYYTYYQNTPAAKEAKIKSETATLIKEVSKHILLTTDEEPAIFVITDPAQLSAQQAFFANAIQGDKLLVYWKTAKAIIYSPERKLIVNVGPVTFDEKELNTEPSIKAVDVGQK